METRRVAASFSPHCFASSTTISYHHIVTTRDSRAEIPEWDMPGRKEEAGGPKWFGPSTGAATQNARGDVLFAVYGSSGSFPIPVFASATPGDVYGIIRKAVNATESLPGEERAGFKGLSELQSRVGVF